MRKDACRPGAVAGSSGQKSAQLRAHADALRLRWTQPHSSQSFPQHASLLHGHCAGLVFCLCRENGLANVPQCLDQVLQHEGDER